MPPIKKAIIELHGVALSRKQALEDPKNWETIEAGIEVDHFLPKTKAGAWVKSFNNNKIPLPKEAFLQPSNIKKKILLELLNNPEVESLRFYFGLTPKNKVQVIFVGADKNHNDVYLKRKKTSAIQTLALKTTGGSDDTEEGGIDIAQGCPSYGSSETTMLPG